MNTGVWISRASLCEGEGEEEALSACTAKVTVGLLRFSASISEKLAMESPEQPDEHEIVEPAESGASCKAHYAAHCAANVVHAAARLAGSDGSDRVISNVSEAQVPHCQSFL